LKPDPKWIAQASTERLEESLIDIISQSLLTRLSSEKPNKI